MTNSGLFDNTTIGSGTLFEKGDFTAIGADGSIKFLSSDKYVGANGRLRNRVPGTVPSLADATLVDREIARTERDGSLAVLSLWRAASGAVSLIKTPISSGVLGTSVTLLDAYAGFDTTANLALDVADTSADIIQEFFITERTPDPLDPTLARLRLFEVIEGAADRSYGVHVAQLAGLPPDDTLSPAIALIGPVAAHPARIGAVIEQLPKQ